MAKGARRLALPSALLLAACGSSVTTPPDMVASADLATTADLAAPLRPSGFRGRTVYELFVRSFADSNGDGIGDLEGLIAHLDYLNDGDPATHTDLGVDAIWLMPINPSPSYHGYDVTDYAGINPQYGTSADFDALIAAAHKRGIAVLLDMVLNHSSSKHPWFVSAATGPMSDKRAWYDWSATDLHWSRPWDQTDPWVPLGGAYYYALFGSGMPDLNLANPDVEHELTTMLQSWAARGADGYRLDAVRYYLESADGMLADQPGTHALLKRLHAALPASTLVGEAWTSVERQASYYGSGDELSLAFSFDLADAIKQSVAAGDITMVVNLLARSESAFADRSFEAPFLSNHDQVRVMRALNGDAGMARVAAATLMAMPGTPFVYYGEELGMFGGPGSSDTNKRTPMPWSASAAGHGFTSGTPWYSFAEADGVDVQSEQADAKSLWHLYQLLIGLRAHDVALEAGDATRPKVTGGGAGVLAVLRTDGIARTLFVANYGARAAGAFTVDIAATKFNVALAEGLLSSPVVQSSAISIPALAPHGFAYIQIDPVLQ